MRAEPAAMMYHNTIRQTRKSGKRVSLIMIAAAIGTMSVASGCAADRAAAHPASTAPGITSPLTGVADQQGSTRSVGGLRLVHSPNSVTDDMSLQSGQCHLVVRPAGLSGPDVACTPGAVDPAVTDDNISTTICTSGYTDTVRPPSADTGRIKTKMYDWYGVTRAATDELDHLVSLQLGGANSVSNLALGHDV